MHNYVFWNFIVCILKHGTFLIDVYVCCETIVRFILDSFHLSLACELSLVDLKSLY